MERKNLFQRVEDLEKKQKQTVCIIHQLHEQIRELENVCYAMSVLALESEKDG